VQASIPASLATRVFDAPDTSARCLLGLRLGSQRILRTEELVLLANLGFHRCDLTRKLTPLISTTYRGAAGWLKRNRVGVLGG
jgi:hypothetical protein